VDDTKVRTLLNQFQNELVLLTMLLLTVTITPLNSVQHPPEPSEPWVGELCGRTSPGSGDVPDPQETAVATHSESSPWRNSTRSVWASMSHGAAPS
jgi:hypothetical protein